MALAKSKQPREVAYDKSRIVRLDARHPGLRALVEDRLRRRIDQREIVRELARRFGVRISATSIRRFWKRVVRPEEEAEAEAFRQARAQAKALIAEMKADPKLDAAKIAEIMLANQIVKDRLKLGEADIMALYREQREREKLELQRRAFALKEAEVKRVLKSEQVPHDPEELRRKIDEIYGLDEPPAAAETPA